MDHAPKINLAVSKAFNHALARDCFVSREDSVRKPREGPEGCPQGGGRDPPARLGPSRHALRRGRMGEWVGSRARGGFVSERDGRRTVWHTTASSLPGHSFLDWLYLLLLLAKVSCHYDRIQMQ